MATKLKIITDHADVVPATKAPDFEIAPSRKRHAGWTAERQRKFIEHPSVSGQVGEACALVGLSSSSFYRLCNKVGADSFVKACNAARTLAATRASVIVWDRAINGRVERFYKDGELTMERRIRSNYLLTWLLSRLDPLPFDSPAAKAHALAIGDPREQARIELPQLIAGLADVPQEECECDEGEYIDERLGEMTDGKVARDER